MLPKVSKIDPAIGRLEVLTLGRSEMHAGSPVLQEEIYAIFSRIWWKYHSQLPLPRASGTSAGAAKGSPVAPKHFFSTCLGVGRAQTCGLELHQEENVGADQKRVNTKIIRLIAQSLR